MVEERKEESTNKMNLNDFEADLKQLLEKHKAWLIRSINVIVQPSESTIIYPDGTPRLQITDNFKINISIAASEITVHNIRKDEL